MKSRILYIQLIGLLTLLSYILYLPKINKKRIMVDMPNTLGKFSLISVAIAISSYLYIIYYMYNFEKYKHIFYRICIFVALFLLFSSFWATSLYYKWNIITISSLFLVAICSIGILYTLYHNNDILLKICTLYLVFHTLFIDGILWNYYFIKRIRTKFSK